MRTRLEGARGLSHVILVWVAGALVCLALVFVPLAAGKDFKPGDIRVCVGAKCLRLNDRAALNALSAFYYSRTYNLQPQTAPDARALYVELRFRDGYVTGIAAGRRYDHFLSYGVNLDQFQARTWYAIPARASVTIRRLAARLAPHSLPANALDNSR